MIASVDVIVVNWNGGEDVVKAARSAAVLGARPIVVDNGSEDDSLDLVRRRVPEATVIAMGFNSGFAHACNAGVAAGGGEYVFLLNPDAEIMAGSLSELESAFAWDPRVVVVGPRIVNARGKTVHSARRFPTTLSLTLYQLKLHRLARWIPPLRAYFMLDSDPGQPAIVDQVIGAAFVMRRQDWSRFNGFDEGYFILFEEVDLCRRVKTAGYSTLYWPMIEVRHLGGTSLRRLSHVRLQRLWSASLLRYAGLHLGRTARGVLSLTVPFALVLSAILDLAEGATRARWPHKSPPA